MLAIPPLPPPLTFFSFGQHLYTAGAPPCYSSRRHSGGGRVGRDGDDGERLWSKVGRGVVEGGEGFDFFFIIYY